jgi:hypothetical protein
VLVDDAAQRCFVHVVIPDAFRVHHHERAAVADAQAGAFAPLHPFGILILAEFTEQAAKEVIEPGRLALRIAVFAGAEKYMARIGRHLRCVVHAKTSFHVAVRRNLGYNGGG